MANNEELKIIDEIQNMLQQMHADGVLKMLDFLKDKSKDEMKEIFRHLSKSNLKYLCEDIALPNEYYEVCAVAKDVLESKK